MVNSTRNTSGASTLIGIVTTGVALVAAGLVGATVVQPLVQALARVFALDTVEGLWYVTRAAGLAAYLLLWLSTVWGLAVASKVFDPLLQRVFTFDMHEFLSLLALGFTGLHVGVLLADKYMAFTLPDVLVPFLTSYRPLWVGIGVIAMYLTVLVTATFYLRSRIGYKTFRAIHLLSFLAYAGVTAHSLMAGTDSALSSTKLIYAGTALVIAVLTAHYLIVTRARTTRRGNLTPGPSRS